MAIGARLSLINYKFYLFVVLHDDEGIILGIIMYKYITGAVFAVFIYSQSLVFATEVDSEWAEFEFDDEKSKLPYSYDLYSFAELHVGKFTTTNSTLGDRSIEELNLRFAGDLYLYDVFTSFKLDFINDFNGKNDKVIFHELMFNFQVSDKLNVQAGRQVLSWGTGEQVFLNDLFAKDWQALFAGKEIGYLKKPMDAVRLVYLYEKFTLDLVWSPKSNADIFIDGEMFSYFNPNKEAIVANPNILNASKASSDEFHLRLLKNINNMEVSFYGYYGRHKQPVAFSPETGMNYHPKITSVGSSIRSAFGSGLINGEISHYIAREDKKGTDPFIANSQTRLLVGYEYELLPKLTTAFQYYQEWTQDYQALKKNSLNLTYEPSERRHVITAKLNYQALQDNLTLILFSQYSPNEKDVYIQTSAIYRLTDNIKITLGGNIFSGDELHTKFAQFKTNDNIFFRFRYTI